MDDVAIIGVGLHPFGRFGPKSAIDMGADAVRTALADAGVEWTDVQFAFGGSFEVDNPDAVTSRLGLTGIPFMDVYNGCATAATALQLTADGIRSGHTRSAWRVGMDKHQPGAFTSDPVDYAAPAWYGEIGHFLTTKFFAMKINRYMHDHGISHETLAQGRGQGLPQRRAEPERVPAQADLRGGDPRLADAQLPAHPVHVLRARRGRRGRRALQGRPRPPLHLDADLPASHHLAHPALRRVRGARLVGRGRAGRRRRRCTRPRPPTSRPASGPRRST